MSFLKKLFGGGKNKPAPETPKKSREFCPQKKIPLEDVEAYLSERTLLQVEEFNSGLEAQRKRFIALFNRLIDRFDFIDEREIQPIILENKRDITDIIKTSRSNYTQSSKKLLGDMLVHLRLEKDPEKLHERLTDTFNRLNSLSVQAQILLTAFKDEMRQISLSLKELSKNIEEFGEFLDRDYEAVKKIEVAKNSAKSLIEKREIHAKALERMGELDKEYKNILKELDIAVSQKDRLIKSKDYLHSERLKDELKELEREIKDLRSDFANTVFGISKILKKYLHTQTGLKKAESAEIEKILKDPLLALSDISGFESAINGAKKSLQKIEPDKKKQGKMKQSLALALESGHSLAKRGRDIDIRISEIISEIKEKDTVLVLNEIDTKISEFEERQKNISEELDECRLEASNSCEEGIFALGRLVEEVTGTKVNIK